MRNLTLIATIVALSALAGGCSDNSPVGPGVSTGSGWKVQSAAGFPGAVAALSATRALFAGMRGDVYEARAGAGLNLTAGSGTDWVAAFWVAGSNDVFAVGSNGSIIRYNGHTWSPMASGTTVTLQDIHGLSPNDAYAVGDQGTVLHFDGQQWSPVDANNTYSLGSVRVFPNEVFVGTDRSSILHYDGSTWQETTLPNSNRVEVLWGTSSFEVFALKNDDVFFFDGNTWSVIFHGNGEWNSLWGTSRNNVYIAGTDFQRYDGSSWSPVAGAPEGVRSVSGTFDGTVWALASGNSAYRSTGSGWQQVTQGFEESINGLHGFGANDVFGVAGRAAIHYDGTWWKEIGRVQGFGALRGVWGAAANDVWYAASDNQSNAPVYHWDGQTLGVATTFAGNTLNAVSGTAANDVIMVGNNGFIIRFDGSSWQSMTSGTTALLRAVWGSASNDYWAVGDNGTVLRYNGSSWSLDANLPENLWDVWGVDGKVLAVGSNGAVFIEEGQWRAEDIGTTEHLRAVWGTGPDDIFICGGNGFLTHWDGSEWQPADLGTATYFSSGWSASPDRLWLGGEFGAIFGYE